MLLLAAMAHADPGSLTVNVWPASAVVRVDGRILATGSLPPTALPPGSHTVDVTLAPYVAVHRVVTVAEGAGACVAITLARPPRPPPDPTEATAKAARDALAAGIVSGIASSAASRPPMDYRGDGDTAPPRPPDLKAEGPVPLPRDAATPCPAAGE